MYKYKISNIIKHSYTEIFIAVLYNVGYNNAQAWTSYSQQYIQCMHIGNVLLESIHLTHSHSSYVCFSSAQELDLCWIMACMQGRAETITWRTDLANWVDISYIHEVIVATVIYRMAQMFDRGKFWWIWRIKASLSKFSLSIFYNNLSASTCNTYGSHKSAYWSRIKFF